MLPACQSLDKEAASASALLQLDADPAPSTSPDFRCSSRGRCGRISGQLQQALPNSDGHRPCLLPFRAESAELAQLHPAMPSTTPALLVPDFPCRRRSMHMQCSEDQSLDWSHSGMRPFPDLAFETDASSDSVLPLLSPDMDMSIQYVAS